MLFQGRESATEIVALEPVTFGDRPNDGSKARVMGMRDVRKQMMLDLVIETASEPGSEARARGEVRRGANLVRGPIISFANASELHPGREVCNLEDYRHHPAQDGMKEEESSDCP
jgi:hypothetical protein